MECEDLPAVAVVLGAMVPVPVDVTARLAWLPEPVHGSLLPYLTQALELAHAVRAWDRWKVRQALGSPYLVGGCVFLAALADADERDEGLLGWAQEVFERDYLVQSASSSGCQGLEEASIIL